MTMGSNSIQNKDTKMYRSHWFIVVVFHKEHHVSGA